MKLSEMLKQACKEEKDYPLHEFPKKLDEALGEHIFMDGIDIDGHLKYYLPDVVKKKHLGNFITYDKIEHHIEFHHSFFLCGPIIFDSVTYVNTFIKEEPDTVGTQMSLYEDVDIQQ